LPPTADRRVQEGVRRYQAGDWAAAAAAWQEALRLDPEHARAALLLGALLTEAGHPEKGAALLRAIVERTPTDGEAWGALGAALSAMGDKVGAVACLRRAVYCNPADAVSAFNLGNGLRDLGRLRGAMAAFERAAMADPTMAAAWSNGAFARAALGYDDATTYYERALALHDLPPARFSLGLILLARGRLAEGWAAYESRFAGALAAHRPALRLPFWRGEKLAGRRLLVWSEQGVGDEMMFASCLADLADFAADGQIVAAFDPRLKGLLARAHPTTLFLNRPPCDDDGDLQIALGSLPGLLRPRLAAFRHDRLPWLSVDAERAVRWAHRLAAFGPGLRVGFAWRSVLDDPLRAPAYVDLRHWELLLRMPGIIPISLQYGESEAERSALRAMAGRALPHWPDLDRHDDLEETAALMANLDLVISVGNATAELASGIGTPVWRLSGREEWTALGLGRGPTGDERLSGAQPWRPVMQTFLPERGEPMAATLRRALRRLETVARAGAGAEIPLVDIESWHHPLGKPLYGYVI
jgi:Tfp pilus assembly protein PilF